MARSTRRQFLQTSSALGAGLVISGTRAAGAFQGANDRVRIAVAGLNGRGRNHLDGWFDQDNVEVAYVIDPDQRVLDRTLKAIDERTEGKASTKGVRDVREALDDDNLDALTIATPNHWHSLMTVWAAQAGKHVYVEKPMSHDIAEGRTVVEAQKKYGVVIQHGTQSRSNDRIAGLHEMLQSGELPRLKIAHGFCCKRRDGIGYASPSSPPSHLDWTLWKGPAVIDQYHDNYVHYNWHWFWESGNGDLNNQGTHQLDIAQWAIDKDQTHPVRAMAIGGRFKWDDQGETPNTMFAIAEYPNGQQVFFNVRNVNYPEYRTQVTNDYYLEDGSKIFSRRGYKILRPGSSQPEDLDVKRGQVTPGGNWGSFIAAVRAGDPSMANGDAEAAHYSCVVGHLMNNSYRLGEKVPFNAKAGRFGDNAAAAEEFLKIHEIMRDGVGVPEDGAEYVVGPWLSFDPEAEQFVGERAEEANELVKDPTNAGFEMPRPELV